MDKRLWRGRGRDLGGACPYSRRGLRLRRRGAYGIHRASGPWCQGLCRKVASLRSGGRRLAVRKTIEYQIGALPCTPFPAVREFPSRGNERYEGKNSESYTSDTISAFSPFGGWRHHLARREACHWIRGSRGSPMNPVPLPPPQFGWSIKRKALLWAGLGLTLTNLHILCRMCTVAL